MVKLTDTKLSLASNQVRAFDMTAYPITDATLSSLGIGYSEGALNDLIGHYGMDALPAPITSGSVPVALQFLQQFLTSQVKVVTAARKIDDIVGRDIAGTWAQEEVVLPIVEEVGQARPYTDKSDNWNMDYNVNYETRTIQRFEADIEVGVLEEERAGMQRINAGALKRSAAATALAIVMNDVGFNGYADGASKTYGLLNDPNLPAYVTVVAGASNDTLWSSKKILEIIKDIRTAFSVLAVKSGGNFQPTDPCTLTLPNSHTPYLTVVSEFGYSVRKWLADNYPNCKVESAVQLELANGGENVFYLAADKIGESKVVSQNVQEVLRLIGFEKKAKGTQEVYANATAGVLFAQPVGVVRYTGI